MNGSLPVITILIIALVAIVCCVCLCALLFFGLVTSDIRGLDDFNFEFNVTPVIIGESNATATPRVIRPTPQATSTPQPTPLAQATQPGTSETLSPTEQAATPSAATAEPFPTEVSLDGSEQTLKDLQDTLVPISDVRELSMRLQGKDDIPLTVEAPAAPLKVGATDTFWATNTDTNENFEVNATLRYVTPHLYFWIEDGIRYDESDLRELAETFENEIYPTNREFFGSEWSPGVDNDPHLYVLLARNLGSSIAGYFSSSDEFSPLAHEYSNAHEMFLLSADPPNFSLDDEFTYSVLAHEFQHMIHWYRDRNETSWLNEGFSELAAFLNGYNMGGFDYVYTINPDIQLNDWPKDPDTDTSPHYGAGFLFVTYFLDRFSEEATQALVSHDQNGMASVDAVLQEIGAEDPQSGVAIDGNDVFFDWVLANYLQDPSVGDGRFTYQNYPSAPQTGATEEINRCPTDTETRDVHQYGVDYIRIQCRGNYTLHFEGSTQVNVVPADPYSGSYAFWSNKGDESDITLTQTFDFTEASGPLTFSYWTWYDIEEDWDYLYLEASLDGENWQILTTPSGTGEDPIGNSFGWGYTGLSGRGGDWIQEEVDLSQFAGQEVQLRFEYVTDASVHAEGFLLDDVSIPEIDYFTDFEEDDGGWEAEGFVRIQNVLPQTFRLAVISEGQETTVEYITLNDDMSADIPLQIEGTTDEVTLVVSGTTRFTRHKAAYRFSINP